MRWVSASLKIFVKALPGLSVPPPSDVGAPLPNWLSPGASVLRSAKMI